MFISLTFLIVATICFETLKEMLLESVSPPPHGCFVSAPAKSRPEPNNLARNSRVMFHVAHCPSSRTRHSGLSTCSPHGLCSPGGATLAYGTDGRHPQPPSCCCWPSCGHPVAAPHDTHACLQSHSHMRYICCASSGMDHASPHMHTHAHTCAHMRTCIHTHTYMHTCMHTPGGHIGTPEGNPWQI